jgi:hypothetical protein
MDRTGMFILGILVGAVAVLGVQKMIEENQLSLDDLEDSLEEKLGALEEDFSQPLFN